MWIGYDKDALYFAFRCDDPEPAGIKTSITRRDNILSDDWVGLSLDALGTGQLSYHMMVNPSGIQLDMINTPSGDEDIAPDWVWESAGRVDDTGYAVEIRLPLQHPLQRRRRRADGDPLLAARQPHRRVGVMAGARAWQVGLPEACSADVLDLEPRPTREVIPSAVLHAQPARVAPGDGGAPTPTAISASAPSGD